MRHTLLLGFLLAMAFPALSQTKVQEIELLHADRLVADNSTPNGANKLIGNVRLQQKEVFMYCDSAYLYDNNSLDAFGNVRIEEGDSLTMTGDSLYYDGNVKLARVRNNVVIDNKSSILKTDYLDYDRASGVAYYFGGGEIDSEQEKTHLTSEKGYYYPSSRTFHFKDSVVMNHPDYDILTDTMHYSSDLEKTWFFGPTYIKSSSRTIYCEYGWFDQLQDEAKFIKNAEIASAQQILKGDTIYYDEAAKIGESFCNVAMIDTNQKFEVTGDYAIYYEEDSVSYVTENLLLKQDMDGDTFFLTADTLHSLVDTLHKRIVKTYHGVRFFKSDLQGKCDSLVYLTVDSIIHLYRDPILWSDANQITADSIALLMKNQDIDRMLMDRNAYIISLDDSIYYNQIKGRDMIAYFKESALSRVDVFGNGETVYYSREDDGNMIGVNETKCANMTIMIDSNKVQRIKFFDQPDAVLTPSDDMVATGIKLKGFIWRADERPTSVEDLMIPQPRLPKAEKKVKKPKALDKMMTTDSNSSANSDSPEPPTEPQAAPESPQGY